MQSLLTIYVYKLWKSSLSFLKCSEIFWWIFFIQSQHHYCTYLWLDTIFLLAPAILCHLTTSLLSFTMRNSGCTSPKPSTEGPSGNDVSNKDIFMICLLKEWTTLFIFQHGFSPGTVALSTLWHLQLYLKQLNTDWIKSRVSLAEKQQLIFLNRLCHWHLVKLGPTLWLCVLYLSHINVTTN